MKQTFRLVRGHEVTNQGSLDHPIFYSCVYVLLRVCTYLKYPCPSLLSRFMYMPSHFLVHTQRASPRGKVPAERRLYNSCNSGPVDKIQQIMSVVNKNHTSTASRHSRSQSPVSPVSISNPTCIEPRIPNSTRHVSASLLRPANVNIVV